MRLSTIIVAVLLSFFSLNLKAQNFDESHYSGLEYRLVGPFRGGRSAAVTGVPNQPNLYYFGATGGGIWKTMNGGRQWENISDGFFGGSIGAIAVAPSDPTIIYVGTGEANAGGGSLAYDGLGIYKSMNEGDCYLLITPLKVFIWLGRYANALEKAKAMDLIDYLKQTKRQ